jgi:hypothetical protein
MGTQHMTKRGYTGDDVPGSAACCRRMLDGLHGSRGQAWGAVVQRMCALMSQLLVWGEFCRWGGAVAGRGRLAGRDQARGCSVQGQWKVPGLFG